MPDVTFSIDSLSTNGDSGVIPNLLPRSCWNVSSDAISTSCCQSLPTHYCQDGWDAAEGEVEEPCPQTQTVSCSLLEEEWSQTLWVTIVFTLRSRLFAGLVDFGATSATAKSSEKLWLEIHRIVFWHCLCIFCMMHGRTVITILVAG